MADSNFIDYVKRYFCRGKGGAGKAAITTAPSIYPRKSGPDGGDGGRGGHIILKETVTSGHCSPLRYRRHIFATERRERRRGPRSHGKDGQDQIVEVPVGTAVFDADSGEFLCEVTEDGQTINLLPRRQGRTRQLAFRHIHQPRAPLRATGTAGHREGQAVVLELKLGDVGLVGFPERRKIHPCCRRCQPQKPKVADYPFTTMEPSLGIVDYRGDRSFVMADIPGIIEGALGGKGLGLRFLRHIEPERRTALHGSGRFRRYQQGL